MPTPGVCVSLSHDLHWGSVPAYGVSDRRGQTAPQTVVCPVLGTITKKSIGAIPIPPNTVKYWPIPQYRYRSNPTGYHFSGLRSCSHSRSGQVPKENLWDNWSNFYRPDTLKKKKALTVAWPHLLSSTARPLIERCSLSMMSHTICKIDVNS